MGIAENIVISGVGGWFPKCRNINEFKTLILDQSDLFDTRWKAGNNFYQLKYYRFVTVTVIDMGIFF